MCVLGNDRLTANQQVVMEPIGLGPTTSCMPGNELTSEIEADDAKNAGDLAGVTARLIDVWPTLPEPIRAGIVAMVEAAAGNLGVPVPFDPRYPRCSVIATPPCYTPVTSKHASGAMQDYTPKEGE